MIKLTKPDKPRILLEKEDEWTTNLLGAISKHGSYKNIPDNEKKELTKHYRHKGIKEVLFESSYKKCAFCECLPEEGGYIQVEHFHPKSLYPQDTFQWINLLPSCGRCNGNKLVHDTILERIVNPYVDDPYDFFDLSFLNLIPKQGSEHQEIAQRTIDVCGLNEQRLFKPRSELLIDLSNYQQTLKDHLEEIKSAETSLKKTRRINRLINSMDIIKELYLPKAKYSFFVKNFIEKSIVFQEAQEIIANN